MKKETLLKIVAWERAYKKRNKDPYTIIQLFQELIDTGEILEMGGRYKEIADTLCEYGACEWPKLKVIK